MGETWSEVSVPWSAFTAGDAAGTSVVPSGDRITGLGFNVVLVYVDDGTGTWVPTAAPLELQVDDITFC